jgi:DNA repair exonuclease SbcCD ATPase subunit
MSAIWASLSATKLQQQLSDVAKELVASEDTERPNYEQVAVSSTSLVESDGPLPTTPLPNGVSASTSSQSAESSDNFAYDVTRLRRELEQSQGEANRLRSYLLEAQSESEHEILSLQRQIEVLGSAHAENMTLRSGLAQAQQDLAASIQREEAARSALRSIEQILANVQSDQEQEISIRTLHLRRQLEETQLKLQARETELEQLRLQEAEYLNQKQQVLQLQIQMDKMGGISRALQQENASLKSTLELRVAKLSAQADASEVMIDKRIIRNLLTSYLNPATSGASKAEVLDIMSRMVSMTADERNLIGVGKQRKERGWFSSLGFSSSSAASADLDEQSLSNLWVQYLAAATGDGSKVPPELALTTPTQPPAAPKAESSGT